MRCDGAQRGVIVYNNVYAYGEEAHEQARDLRTDTAAEVGDGIVEAVVWQAAHTRDEQLQSYEQEEDGYRINDETHSIKIA